jgi:hypothetical protein
MKLFHEYSLYGFSNVYVLGNDETKVLSSSIPQR